MGTIEVLHGRLGRMIFIGRMTFAEAQLLEFFMLVGQSVKIALVVLSKVALRLSLDMTSVMLV